MTRFSNNFQSWLRHSWKLLANRLNRDPKIVIHGNSCIILYILTGFIRTKLRYQNDVVDFTVTAWWPKVSLGHFDCQHGTKIFKQCKQLPFDLDNLFICVFGDVPSNMWKLYGYPHVNMSLYGAGCPHYAHLSSWQTPNCLLVVPTIR